MKNNNNMILLCIFFQTLTYVVHEIKMQNLAGLRFEAEMFF